MFRSTVAIACSMVALVSLGCTSIQLRKHTNQQLRTTSEITQQQIMDNVAKISANENAWPEFSNFASGSTQLSDTGEASLGLTWNARTIISEAFGLRGNRQLTEVWGTTAITDPDRLKAMWAVYHYAIYGSAPETPVYSANDQLTKIFGNGWQKLVPTPGWFQTYCEHDYCEKVHCGCIVGHACDCHACVLPGHEQDLQQLTYLIMYISSVKFKDNAAFPTGIPPTTGGLQTVAPPHNMTAPPDSTNETPDGKLPTGAAREFNSPSPGVLLNPR